MRYALAGLLLVGGIGAVEAQNVPEIAVTPRKDGSGGGAYVGPYGPDLPGVYMFSGRVDSASPDLWSGGRPIPSLQKIPDEYTYQNPLPILDGWHGTLGGGIPF